MFAAIACSAFFVAAEVVLWATGVPTLLEQDDPFRGFSGLVTVFERNGDVYRTRRSTLKSTFNDQSFLAEKPANGLRIFCLGGSSSYGFPWAADAAFTAVLGEVIATSHPELHVEAVNASGVSYAMHRLNIVADELLKYEPDVFIIYSGHNEFVEPAFFEALKRRGAVRTRIEYVMAHSRVYSGMRIILGRGAEVRPVPDDDFSATVRRDDTQAFSPQDKDGIVSEYRWRLERLVRIAQENGVKVMLSTIPCNLRGWSPEASAGTSALSEAEQRAWSEALRSGKLHLDAEEWEAAKVDFERAARLAPGHAETQFRLGQAYEALDRWDDARLAYQRACDADASPTRRVSGINDAIREVGRRQGVLLVDADRVFEELSEHGLVGFDLIKDYVHPTKKGHEIIAWHMWDAMEQAGWLGEKAPAERTVFDRVVAERRRRPQKTNVTWFYNEGVVLAKRGHFESAIESYREALKISPDHVGAMANLGRLLTMTGRAAEAVGLLRQAVEIEPGRPEIHTNLGSALGALGRFKEAVTAHEEALRLNPDYDTAHYNLADALLALGRLKEAVPHYEESLRLNPDYADAHSHLGDALLGLERFSEAVDHYEEALRMKPGLVKSRNNLALTLGRLGRFEKAVMHYEEVLRLKPDYASAHNNFAWLLATCPDPKYRDAEKAVASARRACELSEWKHFGPLHTLGAAYAASGKFDEAVKWQTKAVELAPEKAKAELRAHLELYAAGKPYRGTPKN